MAERRRPHCSAARSRDCAVGFALARRAPSLSASCEPAAASATAHVPGPPTATAKPLHPRAAIVTTLRAVPEAMLRAFVRWHLHIGFCRIYLYFDDPDDPGIALARKLRRQAVAAGAGDARCVVAVPCNGRLHALWSELAVWQVHAGREKSMVEVRQMLNAELALRTAHTDGDVQVRASYSGEWNSSRLRQWSCARVVAPTNAARASVPPPPRLLQPPSPTPSHQWLLHIDSDELFHLSPAALAVGGAPAHFADLERRGIASLLYPNHVRTTTSTLSILVLVTFGE